MRERRLEVAGIGSPMVEAGPADAAEAVVMVHGNPGSSRDWAPLVARVGELARAVAWDQPGFGQAGKPEDFDYTVDGYARHIGACLEALGIGRVHLVLHNLGGIWGLRWAVDHPGMFASATLINTGAMLGSRWHLLARIWRTPLLGELFNAITVAPGFRLALRVGNPRGLPREFVDRMYHDYDRDTRRAILAFYRSVDDLGASGRMLAHALRPLDRPALVVWGAADPYLPATLAERQHQAFPSAHVVMLPDSGHWPFIDNPLAVEAPVLDFLRTQVA